MEQARYAAGASPLALPLTPFIGRTEHVVAVGLRLRHPETRLLTLTGPGGVGKSRLALRAMLACEDAFADGCRVVSLAEVRLPAAVLTAILRQLGLREDAHTSAADQLHRALRNQELLLLLDNCEHLTAVTPCLATLLQRCPGLTILATSRTPLQLHGEHVYPVPPLTLPDLDALPPLARSEAVALFVSCAQAVRPDFVLTEDNARVVAEICARLDELPLALELAAARLNVLSLTALADRLSDRLQLLTGGARDQPPRMQTMRAAIAWSYDLLTSEEQRCFCRLSVFAGGFPLDFVEGGLRTEDSGLRDSRTEMRSSETETGDATGSVLDALASLVDHSLVQRVDRDGEEPRYRLLETIREYGLERLAASGEEVAARASHAAWCVDFAETSVAAWRDSEESRWLDRLAAEEANLREAQDWVLTSGDWRLGLRLAVALYTYWLTRVPSQDEGGWLEQLLAFTPETVDGAFGTVRARAMHLLGILRHHAGAYGSAGAAYEASLAARRVLGDRTGQAETLNNLAVLATSLGDPSRAVLLFEEPIQLCRELGDRPRLARTLCNRALALNALGQHDRAREALQEADGIMRDSSSVLDHAKYRFCLGDTVWGTGDVETARQLWEESLARYQQLGDEHTAATVLPKLSRVALAAQQHARAATYIAEALGHGRASEELGLVAILFDVQAAVAAASGQAEA
ncbi:MAG: tetratricopeptide repeat protein, partial [Chloroflexia bacterium]|nr:tetratricopeptide repeat protein [Chloroflexia bacterium]